MRGIVEEDKYAILRMLLRDAVVKITLGEMGYRQVRGHEDEVSAKVCEVAENAGIKGSSNNKGHFYSLEYKLENVGCELLGLAEILENKDTAEICKYIRSTQNPMYYEIGKSLRTGSPLPNIYQAYTDTLAGYIYDLKTQANPNVRVFLVGNKSDLEEERVVSKEDGERFKEEKNLDRHIHFSMNH